MNNMKKGAVIGVCLSMLLSLFGCKTHYVDGPDMERELWRAVIISQSSDVYEQNFAYEIRYDEASEEVTVSMDVYDSEKGYPDEKSVVVEDDTAAALLNYDLMALPNKTPSPLDAAILDGTFLKLSVQGASELFVEKDAPYETVQEILALLQPYIAVLEGE